MHDDRDVTALGSAAMGVMFYVMSYGHPSSWGARREAHAVHHAAGAIPSGPESDLLNAASARVRLGGASLIPEVDMEIGDNAMVLRKQGEESILKALPVLDAMGEAGRDQAREWLLGVAEKVAHAAKDVDGNDDRVSDDERMAIGEVARLIGAA